MTPVAKVAGGQTIWTRDTVDKALRDYLELYGELTAACFSVSSAKWNDRPELVERYYVGNLRDGGRPWPSLNTIKKHHGGSFNAARVAVGLPPNTPGPAKKRRAAGQAAPIRNVVERIHRVPVSAPVVRERERRVEVKVPSPADKRLRAQATRAEKRLATATERLRGSRERLRDEREKASAATRRAKGLERQVDAIQGSLGLAVSRAKDAEAELAALRREHEKTNSIIETAVREAGETESCLRSELAQAIARISELEGMLELTDEAEMARATAEVEGARAKVAAAEDGRRDAERREGTALRERRAADARAQAAERAAAGELAQRARIQEATVGHARPLSPAEVEALRESGPQGPAVLMAAVKEVATAQSKGERGRLRDALRRVAAAAIGWSDRL